MSNDCFYLSHVIHLFDAQNGKIHDLKERVKIPLKAL